MSERISPSLSVWFDISDPRMQRRFLEAHPGLLDLATDAHPIEIEAHSSRGARRADEVSNRLALLRDIRARGSTVTAIREVYVNVYGGFALDLPTWLEEAERRLNRLRGKHPDDRSAKQTALLLQQALTRGLAEKNLVPEVRAELSLAVSESIDPGEQLSHPQMLEDRIRLLQDALGVFTFARYPRQYARTKYNLGNAFIYLTAGERRANVAEAIACYNQALRVYTRDTFPVEYARSQSGLGNALRQHLEGDHQANLETAITCLEEALKVLSVEVLPIDYAQANIVLGVAYAERVKDERRDNQERAIQSFHEAKRVWTFDAYPYNFARVENNLGIIYRVRLDGDRRENLEQAIACLRRALLVRTREAYPYEYGIGQVNLANVYRERIAGLRRDNLEEAIACLRQALRVFTAEKQKNEFALVQNGLGITYVERIAGRRRDNLERAIVHLRAALGIWTLEASPYFHGLTQHNLGVAYRNRRVGTPQENFEQTMIGFRSALEALTFDIYPTDYRNTQYEVGQTFAGRGDWAAAHSAYVSSGEAEDILIGLGTGTSGRDAILTGEAADASTYDGFALMKLGRIEEAAVAIERGRARGLAEALALDAADPQLIGDSARRSHYAEVRGQFIDAQSELQVTLPAGNDEQEKRQQLLKRADAYRSAKAAFDTVVAQIRAANDPGDFMNSERAFHNLGTGVGCPWSAPELRAQEASHDACHWPCPGADSPAILSPRRGQGAACGRADAGEALALAGTVSRGGAPCPPAMSTAAARGSGWGTTDLSRRIPPAAGTAAHTLAPILSRTARLAVCLAGAGTGLWSAVGGRRATTRAQQGAAVQARPCRGCAGE